MIVFKYPLKLGITVLELPKGAEILSVKLQNGHTMLWALVDKTQPKETRTILSVQTGSEFAAPGKLRFIDTTVSKGGSYVEHVFEILAQQLPKKKV